MQATGKVTNVYFEETGSTLVGDHLATDTVLHVEDSFDFQDTGGTLSIDGVERAYAAVDHDADTITLVVAVGTAYAEDTQVLVVPTGLTKWAMIDWDDEDEGARAVVPTEIDFLLVEGIRQVYEQETVICDDSDGRWKVIHVDGESPVIPGTYIDPIGLPVGSDGSAPASSPTPEVIEGIGAFFLRWIPPNNADAMKFEVHVSQTSGFVPSAATLYTETSSYSATVRHLPDFDEATQAYPRFSYTTEDTDNPYYFKIVAKDEDGAAPASAEAVGRLYQITGPDIAAKTIKGENIIGTTLTGDLFSGTVVLGSTISTGAINDTGEIVGARVDLGPAGIYNYDAAGNVVVKFPTDDTDAAYVRAHFEMLSAEVRDNFSMFGTNNQIGKDGKLLLSNGVVPPTSPPTVGYSYDTVQFDTSTAVPPHTPNTGYNLGTFKFDPSQVTSIAWNSTWSAWVVVQQKSGGFRVWRFTSTGAIMNNLGTGRPWVDDYNDRTDATNAFGTGSGQGQGEATLFKIGGSWYVWGPYINKIPDSWILDVDSRPPVLGYDGVNDRWMLAQSNGGGSGTFHVRKFTLNSGTNPDGSFKNATSQSTFSGEAGSGIAKRPNGVYFGAADFGGNRYVWNVDDFLTVYVFGTDGVLKDNDGSYENWTKPTAAQGFAWDGSQFCSLDSTGKLTKYPNWNWPQLSTTAYVGASAFDSDIAGSQANPHVGQTAGQHETPVGSIVQFSQRRRAKLTITMPSTPDSGGPDDVDKWKLYFARQVAAPVTANLKYIDQIGSPTSSTSKTITADPTGGAPPGGIQGQAGAVNNFPASNPAKFVSTALDGSNNPLIELVGDGSGRLGPYKWNSAGTQIDGDPTYDTGWVNMALTKGGSTPFPNNSSTVITRQRYRRIGKLVHVNIVITAGAAYNPGNTDHTNQTVATGMPAEICPDQNTVVACRMGDTPVSVVAQPGGTLTWTGSHSVSPNFLAGDVMEINGFWFI